MKYNKNDMVILTDGKTYIIDAIDPDGTVWATGDDGEGPEEITDDVVVAHEPHRNLQ